MISLTMFRRVLQARALTTAVFCSALVLITAIMFYPERPGLAANYKSRQLTFEDRVAAQRAIEEVYHRRRIWPAGNQQSKPPLDEVLPDEAIQAKVEDYLRQSSALEAYWRRVITPGELQSEIDRMARDTKQPDALRELWAALSNDPMMIAECMARPALVERYMRDGFGTDERFHALSFDEWWSGARGNMEMAAHGGGQYLLPEIATAVAQCESDSWTAISVTGAPSNRSGHTAIWTGAEMIVWGGVSGINVLNNGARYNPATDSWTSNISSIGAPVARGGHSAVWTGVEMIIWGGESLSGAQLLAGGRYNPATNTWTSNITSTGAPRSRALHTAVWTGNEMIVWGGISSGGDRSRLNTGGRYDPAADSWTADVTTTGAPSGRAGHTAIWTGGEMIVWGGGDDVSLNTGGRYNPATDSWTANITTTGAPGARSLHTAVWTGGEMIVWGGEIGNSPFNTGGRYNPAADSWTANTTTNGAPSARFGHSAIWTGGEMIIWGGQDVVSPVGQASFNSGGRYSISSPPTISPTTQSFTAAGGAGSVNITAPGGCAWTATSDANWLSITSGASGAGNGIVAFSVAANTLGPRTGILTIGGQSFIVRQAGVTTSRVIRVVATRAAPGNIAVPIEIVSQGDENAMGFTLTFDPAFLGNPQVALGADAAGGRLSTNSDQAAQGRLGIVLALAAGQTFTAGTRQFAVVTFTTQANASSGMTQLDFDDLPAAREVSDTNANALPASYQGGSISIVTGFEADIAPRPDGNGSVTVTDYVQIGRFVAGLDTAAAGFEFQRADCAPRASLGDGLLTVADWVQVGRYATGADPATVAGGPTAQASQLSLVNSDVSPDSSRAIGHGAQVRRQPAVIHGRQLAQTGGERQERLMNFVVELDARGNENALGLSLRFDPSQWRFAGATAGRDTRNATLHVNALQSANGYIGLAMALPTGEILPAGAREIVVISFTPLSRRSALTRAVEFVDYPVRRELVDSRANVAPAAFVVEQRK